MNPNHGREATATEAGAEVEAEEVAGEAMERAVEQDEDEAEVVAAAAAEVVVVTRPPLLRQSSLANEAPKSIPAFKARPDGQDGQDDDEDVEICFICANPIIHHSVAPCNHITCHICALRLRALYKNKDCPLTAE